MPVYAYECPKCGSNFDEYCTIAERDTPRICVNKGCDELAVRNLIGSMTAHTTEKEYRTPILSNAMGINPSQIPEAMRKFPHHEYNHEGRMVLRSHAQRNRVMKDLGMHDYDGYGG